MGLKAIVVLIIAFCIILLCVVFRSNRNELSIRMKYNFTKRNPLQSGFLNTNFKYIINNHAICDSKNDKLLAVIIVTSYFSNIETRSAMRKAFPHALLLKFNIRRVFLLGLAPNDKYRSQSSIEEEGKTFSDLIQGNFKEAYKNLTYKHLMGLQWASVYCKHAEYVIKMDDDIVANLYKVTELLKVLNLPPSTIAGYILQGMVPIRDPKNKWFVTNGEYKKSIYPNFVSGWFYITKPYICGNLVNVSQHVEYFWIDDIYVTGILAEKLQLKYYNLGNYFTVFPEILQCCERDLKKFNYDCEILVGPNGGDDNFFYHFNEALSKCYYNPCFKRPRSLNDTCIGEKQFPVGKGNSVIHKL